MSTRTSDAARAVALAIVVLAAMPADARPLFGRKLPRESYAATPPAAPVVPVVATGAIFQVEQGYAALYEGWRARKVGDPLTIALVERTSASKSAGSKLDSNGKFSITPPSVGPLAFDPNIAQASGGRNFGGTGSSDQTNALSGELSVTVAEVYPNGTMLVQGQKRVTLSRGDEIVAIKGIVRIADVDANNRVPSTRVADARISYTGKGDVARASRQGWLSRFFQVVSPF
ncbi:flagellar biosynthesis protein FlgH [Sphingomonas sp. Leaf24]|uniref:flagellar basal body L-ring protein FlgH n=1 Tax=unclassified Sphingomonas TaxID=196159 RepID=UPI0006F6098F|nr:MULTISPECIES: flagellar basal body L-ring protein FlgH [unclassified Sphingomonas]KQM19980.1 flagellar biosynthesis protein FlgH [Sphingomonas sp. Leaf5]KQM90758.1 flagellar biosynthesis protein FlgH [Sphingomonas sp. Leaf24]